MGMGVSGRESERESTVMENERDRLIVIQNVLPHN